jgi:hypothetical protein
MHDQITVTRGDDEYEIVMRWSGHFSKATHLDPPEYPRVEAESATLNGKPIDLKLVPEDVIDEAEAIASDSPGDDPDDEPEPDDVHAGFYDEGM